LNTNTDKIEKLVEVPNPKGIGHILSNEEILNPKLAPIEKLRYMSADQYEDFVLEWVHGYVKKQGKYQRVVRSGGAGDKGRDVIAYIDDIHWDCYQCKYYKSALAPIDIWKELAKLCYYSQKDDYPIPRNYFLMAPDGIGSKLEGYLNDPQELKKGLIENWEKYCKGHITSKQDVLLEGDLKTHVEAFDFSIVKSIPPLELIEQHHETIWHSYRFGGLSPKKKRVAVVPGQNLAPKETRYIEQLLEAYSDYAQEQIDSIEALDSKPQLSKHLKRQRVYFFSADALEQFSRDISQNAEAHFDSFKNEIYSAVIETCEDEHDNGFERVKATLTASVNCSLDGNNILKTELKIDDKKGVCHHLVNENKLKWV
jgi:ABC-3C protein